LNILKNRRISKYDDAYTDTKDKDVETDQEKFVQEVREVFFKVMKCYLYPVKDHINKMGDRKDSEKVFAKYFD